MSTKRPTSDSAKPTVLQPKRAIGPGTVLTSVINSAATGAAVSEAFPGFVYPSVLDTSGSEKSQIHQVLDRLPLHHVSEVDTVSMVGELSSDKEGWVVLGRARDYGVTSTIKLSRTELTNVQKLEDTLIHEVGHTTDYSYKPCSCITCSGASGSGPYGKGPHVTEYAKTNEREDYAETYQEYHQRPERLKEVNPEKYEDMQEANRPNFLERLVDRKEFRETGKYIADLTGPNRPTRHAVGGASAAIGMLQVGNGLQQWVQSADSDNPMQHVSGILNTVSGAVIASGMAPMAGVGIQAANFALGRAVKRGALTAEEVESTVALPVRPLESLFGRDACPVEDHHRPGKVLAVGVGGALGGTVGSLVGPYLGVLGGFRLAGGLGGTIGLIAGGLLGYVGGTELGGRTGAALADRLLPG